MNVLIIEDEELTARRLTSLLHDYDPSIRVLAQLPSVVQSIQWFETADEGMPDLIFLDIHLEDDLGFRLIEQLNLTTPIIFTTAYDEYALQAFKANSVDYLLKPIDADELAAAIDKFKKLRLGNTGSASNPDGLKPFTIDQRPSSYRDRFMVTVGPRLMSVPTSTIAYFYFENKATYLTTFPGQHYIIDYSLDKLGQLLDPNQFFRINRSFLVALSAIQSVYTYSGSKLKLDLLPESRQEIFVSIDRVTAFKEWLGR
ncbi:LytR/AlgR family response regulator transcription factor [Larkinella rosea]|uniref:DNA-binding response regulator n=1 Tax=Larkinella rosea TaxID=2025312 RepID=A0A3P1C2H1_9BACT|nr:LytTR family DNA-binding domain-containing protein [Larkinella rosea]RRB07449.1 DNA-binding response regulator [Larkinella rosea]